MHAPIVRLTGFKRQIMAWKTMCSLLFLSDPHHRLERMLPDYSRSEITITSYCLCRMKEYWNYTMIRGPMYLNGFLPEWIQLWM